MKNAMIWGAGGGIGRALAQKLKKADWTVVGIGRSAAAFEDVVDHAFEADTSSDYAVQNAVMAANYEVDAIQLWVYAAGDIIFQKAHTLTPDEWQRTIGANLTGPYLTYHRSLPLLAEDAHLVFLGAVSERLQLPGMSAYVAAKSGLEAFAGALKKEERQRRITVVRPGAVATPFWDKLPLRLPKDAASPEKVALKIIAAHEEGFSGQLDLV